MHSEKVQRDSANQTSAKSGNPLMISFRKLCVVAVAASGMVPAMAMAQEPVADEPVTSVVEPIAAETAVPEAAPVEAAAVPAEAEGATPPVPENVDVLSPLRDGGYVSVLGTYQITKRNDPVLDNPLGGTFLMGYRNGWYAVETGFAYTEDAGVKRQSWKLRGLIFPFESVPYLYAVLGGGITRYVGYPVVDTPQATNGRESFTTGDLAAGLGYMLPVRIGRYEFGIRAEGLYEVGDRFLERQSDFITDISAPSTFKDIVINVGLQLPLAFLPPPPPAPEPVKVIEAPKPVDTDGDGVPDDLDMCPDTPAGTQVDAKGCPLAPPCKQPVPGERISLQGCATGDVVVLRGVNFDFDKSKLTVNAKTILDNVGDELKAYPAIKVEIGGHTDAKGSDEYNQRLSEARANAVLKYLAGAVGYGESKPVADNETDEGRELNRRVELKIVDGRAEGVSVAPAVPAEAAVSAEAAPADAMPAEAAPAADAPVAEAAAGEVPAAVDASSPFDPIQ